MNGRIVDGQARSGFKLHATRLTIQGLSAIIQRFRPWFFAW